MSENVLTEFNNDSFKASLILMRDINANYFKYNFVNGTTMRGTVMTWGRYLRSELTELMDEFPWKYSDSGHSKLNYEKILLEVVDVYTLFLLNYLSTLDQETLATNDFSVEASLLTDAYQKATTIPTESTILEVIEELMHITHATTNIKMLTEAVFKLFVHMKVTPALLVKYLNAKTALNVYRIDRGIQKGKYKKERYGIKDIDVLCGIIKQSKKTILWEDYYELLEKELAKIKPSWLKPILRIGHFKYSKF